MPVCESQKKAKKKWEKTNYETIGLRFKIGERARIKAFAESQGKSLNGFIVDAIAKAMPTREDE